MVRGTMPEIMMEVKDSDSIESDVDDSDRIAYALGTGVIAGSPWGRQPF